MGGGLPGERLDVPPGIARQPEIARTAIARAEWRAGWSTWRDFHDGLETERVGIIYGGQDLSVTEGKKFSEWKITKVVDNKTSGKLEISWSAKFNGVAVDPCNAVATATAPVFFNLATFPANEGGLSIIRSYAIGDDYVVGTGSSPVEPGSVNVTSANTTCAANVATTLINRDAKADGTRAILALQGKPLLPIPAGMTRGRTAGLRPDVHPRPDADVRVCRGHGRPR